MKSERSYPIYKVNKKAEASLVGGHPWVYENDILEFPETEPENGTLADVVSPKGAYLGTGFVSLKSKIRVRLISRNANDTFDASFWRRRVEYVCDFCPVLQYLVPVLEKRDKPMDRQSGTAPAAGG